MVGDRRLMAARNYAAIARQYAESVVARDTPACRWVQLACQRQLNVVAHLDAKDNIYPRKERPENKIDGIVALIMAISRAILPGDAVVLDSDYELMML